EPGRAATDSASGEPGQANRSSGCPGNRLLTWTQMTIDRSLDVRSSSAQVTSATLQVARPDLRELTSLALQGLVSMFDPEKQLFCDRLFRGEQGYVREGLSPRYTLMTLLGLREMERAGVRV